MPSATSNVKYAASRAADSKPLEYVARGGFVGYGIVHLIFGWIALQLAFGGSSQESDQSGALRQLAGNGVGKALLVLIAIGMVGLAVWQAFEAAIGESGPQDRSAIAERVISGVRAILYLWLAWYAVKVLRGAQSSMADNQESKSAGLMAHAGGRGLVGFIGLVVLGVGIGIFVYGVRKTFLKHLNTQQMAASVRRSTTRLGVAGYAAKGVAYAIAGVLVVAAAVTYDPDKARGLDAALKTLAGHPWGVWLLGLIGLGIAAFGIYCFAQARYRKV
jgi:F0F1-type ATP synthase assembly protein I